MTIPPTQTQTIPRIRSKSLIKLEKMKNKKKEIEKVIHKLKIPIEREPQKYPISYEQLKDLVIETKGEKQIDQLIS